MNETMTPTVDVLRMLGVTYWTLNAVMRAGYVPKPKLKVGTSYVWTVPEIDAARRYFDGRKARKEGE